MGGTASGTCCSLRNSEEAVEVKDEEHNSNKYTPVGKSSGPETLEWATLALQGYWPSINTWATRIVQEDIRPSLQRSLPSMLEEHVTISNFTIGSAAPKMGPIMGHARHTNDARLTFRIEWATDLTCQIDFKSKLLGNVMSVGIGGIQMTGELNMVFKIDDKAIVSGWGATIYFLDVPDIDLDFTGMANVLDFPGVRYLMRRVIEKALCKVMVLPQTAELIFASAQDNSTTSFKTSMVATPIGALQITLLHAEKLSAHDKLDFFKHMTGHKGKYMTVSMGSGKCRSDTFEPNMQLVMIVHDCRQSLKIDIWDDELISADDRIAQAGPFTVREALALSGKEIVLKPSGKKLCLQVQWLEAVPKWVGEHGAIVCVNVSSVSIPVGMGTAVMVKARVDVSGKTIQEAESRVAKRSGSTVSNCMRELMRNGIPAEEVERLPKAYPDVLKKIGLLTHLFMTVTAAELKVAKLFLSIEADPDGHGKHRPVGNPWVNNLHSLLEQPGHIVKGPMSFCDEVAADLDVELWGYKPCELES